MPNWLIHLVRLTVFSTEVITPSEKLWCLATGEAEAENRTSVGGGRQYSGHKFGGIVQLAFLGNRLDLVLSVDPETISKVEAAPAVGPASVLIPEFERLARQLLSSLDFPVNRIAFGGQFFLPAHSRQESYEQIGALAKSIDVDSNKAREMIFRINWPLESNVVPALTLNRLTTFTSMMFGQMMLQGHTGHVTMMPTSPNMIHVTSLETDHNTAAEHVGSFAKEQVIPIFEELFRLNSENLESGEIR